MFADHAEFTAIKTQEPFAESGDNWEVSTKSEASATWASHGSTTDPHWHLSVPLSLIRWFSAARGKFTEIHRPIPSAFRDSSRAQWPWHRLILKDYRGNVWMTQPSPGSPPSPNIPGTPSAVARRGPAKPLHTQKWREWAPGPAHTHIDTHYLGWGLHSHQDYKNKHNTIKMGISSSSLFPSHPFPVSYYYPYFLLFSWTHKEYLDNTGQNREGGVLAR